MKLSKELTKLSRNCKEPNNYKDIKKHLKKMARLGFYNCGMSMSTEGVWGLIQVLQAEGMSACYDHNWNMLEVSWPRE